jgi:hypothetical protein
MRGKFGSTPSVGAVNTSKVSKAGEPDPQPLKENYLINKVYDKKLEEQKKLNDYYKSGDGRMKMERKTIDERNKLDNSSKKSKKKKGKNNRRKSKYNGGKSTGFSASIADTNSPDRNGHNLDISSIKHINDEMSTISINN